MKTRTREPVLPCATLSGRFSRPDQNLYSIVQISFCFQEIELSFRFVKLSYALSRLRVDCFRILRRLQGSQEPESPVCPAMMQLVLTKIHFPKLLP